MYYCKGVSKSRSCITVRVSARVGLTDHQHLSLLTSDSLFPLKADKEFVWMLWKELQSQSPEMTSAVDAIVTRYNFLFVWFCFCF